MNDNLINKMGIHIVPIFTSLFIPPMIWKGDSLGHVGQNDTFFWVLEGECFLKIESEYSVIKPGQLAFLPKGKMRAYTQVSSTFSMYEMAFSATVGEKNLMEIFGMNDGDYVVSVENKEEMSALFENSYRTEMNKNPLYDIAWCANILNIISIYNKSRQIQSGTGKVFFLPVVKYMEEHLTEHIRIEDLAATIYMEPTYFIRKFKKEFGVPPLTYFIQMRIYKAMEYLSNSDLSIDEISKMIGVNDSAYFSRMFKKFCKISPSEYRKAFKTTMHYGGHNAF